MFEHLI